MLKRNAAFLAALLIVFGVTAAGAATPIEESVLDLQQRVGALEARVAALDGLDVSSPQEPTEGTEEPAEGDEEPPAEPEQPAAGDPEEPTEEAEQPADEPVHEHDAAEADVVLSGDYPGGIVVEQGEIARIDGLVTTPKNVVVHGTLVMRPGAHLRFRDVDMTAYVGAGGHDHQPIVESDVGLWVTHHGVLDLAGSPKQGWNRTGTHSTWKATDEYWISPTEPGDYDPRPWKPGDPIPRFDPRVPSAEVMNVTRDVVIEGPGHIHVHSSQPQRIEYVQLRSMGVSNAAHEGPVLGRYALHLHHGGDGTRGSIVRGVAAINSRGKVFVPHMSHGITFQDVVSVNSYAEAFWWDKGDTTEDVLVDGLAASGVRMPEAVAGTRRNIPVVVLKSNEGATMRNSAVSGSRGRSSALGFHWNTSSAHRLENRAVWDFHGNVSHNNEGNGLRFWFNDKWAHNVRDTAIYNNGGVGIENGAYINAIRYENVLVLNNEDGGILHHSSSSQQIEDGGPSRYTNVTVEGPGAALEIGRLRGTPEQRQEFIDCDLNGSTKVVLDTTDKTLNPFVAAFRNCGDLTPDDFVLGGSVISPGLDGSTIIIEHADGRSWEITIEGGRKVVNRL
jgi:hypothetical protein